MALEGHTEIEILNIGNIDFGGDLGECKVEVYKADLDKPCMRITSLDGNFKTAIGIFENKIYPYGDEESDTLSPEQCEIFNTWMGEQNKRLSFIFDFSNWYNAVNCLGMLCEDRYPYPEELKQPDYRVLM